VADRVDAQVFRIGFVARKRSIVARHMARTVPMSRASLRDGVERRRTARAPWASPRLEPAEWYSFRMRAAR
jgi:hypothetical protein